MDRKDPRKGLKRAVFRAAVALFIALSVVAPARADATDQARALLDAGDVAAAVRLLEPLAAAGDASAEYLLGKVHLDGLGMPQDFTSAAAWIAKAAEKGDARAQNALGRLHAEGLGVAQDANTAVLWMRRAAEQGDPTHQYDLAILLDDARLGI